MKRILCLGLMLCVLLSACGQKAPTWQEQYDLGLRYLEEHNYEEAILAFTAAIEIDPRQAPAYTGRGDAYVGLAHKVEEAEGEALLNEAEENYRKALEDYLTAIELDETLVDVYQKAAEVYMMLEDLESAEIILKSGLEITESNELKESLDAIESSKDYVIEWKDLTFERLIRAAMGRPTGDILCSELEEVETLKIYGDQYISILFYEDHKLAVNFNGQDLGGKEPMSYYRHLRGVNGTLSLACFYAIDNIQFTERGTITSIEDIVHFRNLYNLEIIANHIRDITPLLELEHIHDVNVWGNEISNVSDLQQLDSLALFGEYNDEQFVEIGDILKSH